MHTTYGMDACIETNEILAFGMKLYSRYIPGICKNLEYVRHISDICLTYDTIRIPDECKPNTLHFFDKIFIEAIRSEVSFQLTPQFCFRAVVKQK